MIYKSRFKFYKLYKGNYKIEDRGYKIKINNYIFYVDKLFVVTEEMTGKKIQFPENFNPTTLEEIEDYLNYILPFINVLLKENNSNINDAISISEEDYYRLHTNKKIKLSERC